METNRGRICIIIFVSLILTSFMGSAQSGYKLTDLQGKSWFQKGTGNNLVAEKYEADKLIISLNNKHIAKFEYYLSNDIDTVFDSAKIGKVSNGRYIIRRPYREEEKMNPPLLVSVFEIIELSQNSLVLKNSKQQLLEYCIQE